MKPTNVLRMLIPLLAVAYFSTGCESLVYQPSVGSDTPKMSSWKARRQLQQSLAKSNSLSETVTNIAITPDSLQFVCEGDFFLEGHQSKTFSFRFREMNYGLVMHHGGEILEENRYYYVSNVVAAFGARIKPNWDRPEDAKAFADALNALIWRAKEGGNEKDAAEFNERAKAWRELPTKPAVPEEVIRQNVLAENALKERRFEIALEHYETALDSYPTWPQGQFNAANLCAEAGNYTDAAEHARRYLELFPDAPNAVDMKKKMIIWEDKAHR